MEALAGNRSPHSMRSLLFGNDSFPPAALPESKPWWINSFPTTWPSSRYFTQRKGWFLLQKGDEGQQQLLCMGRDCSGVLPPLPSTAVSPAAATMSEYVTLPPALGGGCDLLRAPLAQEGLVHSMKEINYFCYLKKNPLGLVSLTFKLSSTCTLQ